MATEIALTATPLMHVMPSPRSNLRRESCEGGRILVVDDDPYGRTALRAVLSTAHFDLAEAENGFRALLKVGSCPERPSPIILDLAMPDFYGVELMETLGTLTTTDRPDVIVPSAYLSEANDATRAAELCARVLLSTPLSPYQLLHVVRRCLANRLSRAILNR